MPCMHLTEPLEINMTPGSMGEEAWLTPAPPIGLKVEAAMASAEINVKLVCPLRTPNFPLGTHDYNPKKHNPFEGVSNLWSTGKKSRLSLMSIVIH